MEVGYCRTIYSRAHSRSLLRRKEVALGVVRLVVLATLCFLLLEPLLRSTSSEIEPSTMVILIDESASQVVGNDSLKRKSALRVWAQEGAPSFESLGYNIEVFGFAKSVTSREATDSLAFQGQ